MPSYKTTTVTKTPRTGGSGARNDAVLDSIFKGPLNTAEGQFADEETFLAHFQEVVDLKYTTPDGVSDSEAGTNYWGINGYEPNYAGAPSYGEISEFKDVASPPATPFVPNPASGDINTGDQPPAPEEFVANIKPNGGFGSGPIANSEGRDIKNSSAKIGSQTLKAWGLGKSS